MFRKERGMIEEFTNLEKEKGTSRQRKAYDKTLGRSGKELKDCSL
jgi:hypothetical protein